MLGRLFDEALRSSTGTRSDPTKPATRVPDDGYSATPKHQLEKRGFKVVEIVPVPTTATLNHRAGDPGGDPRSVSRVHEGDGADEPSLRNDRASRYAHGLVTILANSNRNPARCVPRSNLSSLAQLAVEGEETPAEMRP
jgi:hypothetical protein